MSNVTVFDHPLIQHKTTILRKKETSNKEFRNLVEEITMLMCYEALRDLPLEDVDIERQIMAYCFAKHKPMAKGAWEKSRYIKVEAVI